MAQTIVHRVLEVRPDGLLVGYTGRFRQNFGWNSTLMVAGVVRQTTTSKVEGSRKPAEAVCPSFPGTFRRTIAYQCLSRTHFWLH